MNESIPTARAKRGKGPRTKRQARRLRERRAIEAGLMEPRRKRGAPVEPTDDRPTR